MTEAMEGPSELARRIAAELHKACSIGQFIGLTVPAAANIIDRELVQVEFALTRAAECLVGLPAGAEVSAALSQLRAARSEKSR